MKGLVCSRESVKEIVSCAELASCLVASSNLLQVPNNAVGKDSDSVKRASCSSSNSNPFLPEDFLDEVTTVSPSVDWRWNSPGCNSFNPDEWSPDVSSSPGRCILEKNGEKLERFVNLVNDGWTYLEFLEKSKALGSAIRKHMPELHYVKYEGKTSLLTEISSMLSDIDVSDLGVHHEEGRLRRGDLKASIKTVAKHMLTLLDAIHREGFVHTDITPSSITINEGRAVLTNFHKVQAISADNPAGNDINALGKALLASLLNAGTDKTMPELLGSETFKDMEVAFDCYDFFLQFTKCSSASQLLKHPWLKKPRENVKTTSGSVSCFCV